MVETPSELEKQIAVARRAVTGTYLDARSRVQEVVSRWIGIEQAVECAFDTSFLSNTLTDIRSCRPLIRLQLE